MNTWRDDQAFDAIVARLLLFHVPDPVRVVRHHVANLRPGGRFVAIEYDLGSSRCEPPIPLFVETISWIRDAFAAAGLTRDNAVLLPPTLVGAWGKQSST